jgi:hypothetical protein
MALVTRTSPFTGITRTLDLPVTFEQMRKFNSGEGYVQDIFSNLTAGEREFILTGISDDEWSEHIGED